MTERLALLVIDTDPGTDDLVAFVLSTLLEGYGCRAFVSTYGNMGLDVTHPNMRKALSFAGLEGRVFRGSGAPLAGELPDCGGYHGPDGLGGVAALIDDVAPAEEGTLAELAELICSFDSCDYVAIGPLTNLALMQRERPEVMGHIGRLLVMGGGFRRSNQPHGAEYNFAADPVADAEVFASGVPITLFPLDLTHRYPLTPGQLASLPFSEGSVMRLLLEANSRSAMAAGDAGAVIHDAFPVLYLKDPEAFEVEPRRVAVNRWGATRFSRAGVEAQVVVSAREGLLSAALGRLDTLA